MLEMNEVGTHLILDGWGVSFEVLNDPASILALIVDAAGAAGATVIASKSHVFSPYGVTAFALLSESHLSIHTYPESGQYMSDIFTCGHHTDPMIAVDMITHSLGGGHAIALLRRPIKPSALHQSKAKT